jgi:hypothetical protein
VILRVRQLLRCDHSVAMTAALAGRKQKNFPEFQKFLFVDPRVSRGARFRIFKWRPPGVVASRTVPLSRNVPPISRATGQCFESARFPRRGGNRSSQPRPGP